MEPTPLGCHFMSKFNKELKEFILRTRKYTNNNTRNKGDNIYKTLYVDLARYFLLQKEIPIGDKVVDVNLTDDYIGSFKSNRFITKEIIDYCITNVKNNNSKLLSYNFQIEDIKYQINYIFFKKIAANLINKMKQEVRNLIPVLRLFNKYNQNKNVEYLRVMCYMTPMKKELPEKGIIGPKEVNTGSVIPCQKKTTITVFRVEEHFKVIIHELIHALCIDFSTNNYSFMQDGISKIFPIKSDFLLSETYCEFWALNLYLMTKAINFSGILDVMKLEDISVSNFNEDFYNEFDDVFTSFLYIEKFWSMFQVVKILDYMGLKYVELFNVESKAEKKALYRENTNVFAYYVMKTVILFFNDEFLINNLRTTNTYIYFPGNEIEALSGFYKFITKYYNNTKLLKEIQSMEKLYLNFKDIQRNKSKNNKNKIIATTMRMTVI